MFKLNLFLALSVLTNFGAIAIAGNGSGHSGPNLAPVSLPILMDRGIEVYKLQYAINLCAAGIKLEASADHELLEPWTPVSNLQKNSISRTLTEQAFGKYLLPTSQLEVKVSHRPRLDAKTKSIRFAGFSAVLRPADIGQPTAKFSLDEDDKGILNFKTEESEIGSFSLSSPVQLPYFSFDQNDSETGFDELGRPDVTYQLVSGVKIIVPSNSGIVNLVNTDSKQKSAVSLNLSQYTECLATEAASAAQ